MLADQMDNILCFPRRRLNNHRTFVISGCFALVNIIVWHTLDSPVSEPEHFISGLSDGKESRTRHLGESGITGVLRGVYLIPVESELCS